jgi:aminoglycoside phosphotransferase (APT) family kinase protein
VSQLLEKQFRALASLPLTAVERWGTDHAIWRLGNDLVVRVPRIHWAADQATRETAFLADLRRHLTIEVPVIVGIGEPGCGYPYHWAIHRWLEGNVPEGPGSSFQFADEVAAVIRQLQSAPTATAPSPRGRARPLIEFDADTRASITEARDVLDAEAAVAIWEDALAADSYDGDLVWVHGDLEGNLLVNGRDGVTGLIDWGSACAGDPASDIRVAWSGLFTEPQRQHLLAVLTVDDATLARSRGIAISQASAALPYYLDTYPAIVERARRCLDALDVAHT